MIRHTVPGVPARATAGGTVIGMELHCDTCARVRTFERPGGTDRVCTACGAAIVVAPVIMLMDRRPRVLLRRAA